MSRLHTAARLAVELPLRVRDVAEALRVTHDNERQAVTVCEIAIATATSVWQACDAIRGLNSMNGETCQLGPFRRADGFCLPCGRRGPSSP